MLLAALFVRALVPEGFMPAQGEMVEFCTMHGSRMVMVDPVTGELLETEEQEATPPCPWAMLLTALAAPTVPFIGVDAALAAAPNSASRPLPAGRSSLALPPARAPPPGTLPDQAPAAHGAP